MKNQVKSISLEDYDYVNGARMNFKSISLLKITAPFVLKAFKKAVFVKFVVKI